MKLFSKLDSSLQSLLIICSVFFFLRLPSLFEPYWYGDEAIYQVMARAMNSGRILFSEVWDNKPPLLYLLYALYDGNQFAIRLISLLFGLASLVTLFFLCQKLFTKQKAVTVTTGVFAVLFGLPFIEGNIANAENFFLLPVIVGMYLLVLLVNKQHVSRSRIEKAIEHSSKSLFLPGMFFGIAFLFKTVTLFDFLAGITITIVVTMQTLSFKDFAQKITQTRIHLLQLVLGFFFPFALSIVYFTFQGALSEYIAAAFSGNVNYVGYKNALFIPQGLLILKTLILLLCLGTIITVRQRLPQSLVIILVWLSFSVFSVFFAQRPYPHYLLAMLPAFALLVGSLFEFSQYKKQIAGIIAALLILIIAVFKIHHYRNQFSYYLNFIMYVTHIRSEENYFNYFDRNTTTWYSVANYIKSQTSPGDVIFVWANSPQIYYLSETLPPGKYVVGYHIAYNKKAEEETKKDLLTNPPKYIVVSDDIPYYPFSLLGYQYKATISNTDIYEKIY